MFNRFRLVKLLFLVLLFGYLFCIAFALTETGNYTLFKIKIIFKNLKILL